MSALAPAVDGASWTGAVVDGRFGAGGGFLAAATAGDGAAAGGAAGATERDAGAAAAGGDDLARGSGFMMLTGGVEAEVGNSAFVGFPVGIDGGSAAIRPLADGAFHDAA